jgi:hypothetical protein
MNTSNDLIGQFVLPATQQNANDDNYWQGSEPSIVCF